MSNIQRFQMYIGGEWCDPASGEWFESYNPYTGQVWAEIPRGSAADAERAVAAAYGAFTSGPWPSLNAAARKISPILPLGDDPCIQHYGKPDRSCRI